MGAALAAALEQTGCAAGGSGRVLVGCSGGLDSTVLLHAAAHGCPGRVIAVHVNHGLHHRADEWQAHVARAAAAWGAGFVARRVSVASSGSLEAAARDARYQVFRTLLTAPDDVLLLAHHRDDQAETVLLRLLQGRGVYGMPARRTLGAGMLLRPLLALPRASLLAYARSRQLRWLEDPANSDLRMDRNFLRQRIMPALRERFAGVDEALLAVLERQRRADAELAVEVEAGAQRDSLPLARLGSDRALAVERLRVWLAAHGLPLPARAALRAFLEQVSTAAPDRAPQLTLHGARLQRHRSAVHLVRPLPALQSSYAVAVPGRLVLPHGELRIEHAAGGFRPDGAVTVQFRRGGEALTSGGHRRTVKALLQGAQTPPWTRAALPLLYDDRGLLAVPGLAVRDDARAPEGFRAVWLPGVADSANG